MLLAFVAAAAAAIPTATPINRGSWFSANDYPIEAIKNHLQGSVTFQVGVDAEGKPTSCSITKSSGQPILDETTCAVVRMRAQFKPATDRSGKPVPGRYSTTTVWKLAGGGTAFTFYYAVILDFSNPDQPVCKIESSASLTSGLPTCEQVLAQHAFLQQLSTHLVKAVLLTAVAPGGQEPYHGKSNWGARLSFSASEQYYSKGSGAPFACISLVADGFPTGRDACTSFPGQKSISEAEKKNASSIRTEVSIFGVQRLQKSPSNGCKTGESEAESLGCD